MKRDSQMEEVIVVEPAQGRETQMLYWFRLCVAEWHSGVHPLVGTTREEILVWDRGRSTYVLEQYWYGKDVPRRRERTALDERRVRDWAAARGGQIVWRDDAVEFYPSFVRPIGCVASNERPFIALAPIGSAAATSD